MYPNRNRINEIGTIMTYFRKLRMKGKNVFLPNGFVLSTNPQKVLYMFHKVTIL